MTAAAYDPLKRIIDVVAAATGLVATAPVQVAVAVLVRWRLGPPVLFRQQRPGKDEKIFELLKFRTMLASDERAGLITDEQRMTNLGAFLRSTSLDELPSLWNVVKGDMSLVGPRPLLVQYLDRYSTIQRRRHEVRPGITGLAQVSGRNALTWETRFERDVEYVKSRSLMLDLRIVLQSFRSVITREGITDGRSVSMTEFRGQV